MKLEICSIRLLLDLTCCQGGGRTKGGMDSLDTTQTIHVHCADSSVRLSGLADIVFRCLALPIDEYDRAIQNLGLCPVR